nr:hypothetical protein K-LCC10_0309 [Kaumoebavirus]
MYSKTILRIASAFDVIQTRFELGYFIPMKNKCYLTYKDNCLSLEIPSDYEEGVTEMIKYHKALVATKLQKNVGKLEVNIGNYRGHGIKNLNDPMGYTASSYPCLWNVIKKEADKLGIPAEVRLHTEINEEIPDFEGSPITICSDLESSRLYENLGLLKGFQTKTGNRVILTSLLTGDPSDLRVAKNTAKKLAHYKFSIELYGKYQDSEHVERLMKSYNRVSGGCKYIEVDDAT